MTYTIVTSHAQPSDQFSFGDLELNHQECGAGLIELQELEGQWKLECKRCGLWRVVLKKETGTVAIINTAFDGQRRPVQQGYGGDGEIYVVRR